MVRADRGALQVIRRHCPEPARNPRTYGLTGRRYDVRRENNRQPNRDASGYRRQVTDRSDLQVVNRYDVWSTSTRIISGGQSSSQHPVCTPHRNR